MRTRFYILIFLDFSMGKINIVGKPEVSKKNIPDEGDYYEVEWPLNESPNNEWDYNFEKMMKPRLEKSGTLLGTYKPKIINNVLILTIDCEEKVEKQKAFFEKEFFEPINNKLYK